MAVLSTVRTLGLSKGVFGNSRFWLVVGGAAWALKAAGWARAPHDKVVFREALEPGESLLLRVVGPPLSRRDRKDLAKTVRRLSKSESSR